MREYLLYVKECNSSMRAYVTPHFSVDKMFWQEQDGGRLHVIGTCSSLSLVFALREQINRYLLKWKQSSIAPLLLSVRKLIRSYVEGINRAYKQKLDRLSSDERVSDTSLTDQADSVFRFAFAEDFQKNDLGESDSEDSRNLEEQQVENQYWQSGGSHKIGSDRKIESPQIMEISNFANKLLSVIGGRSLLWEEMELLLQRTNNTSISSVPAALQWLVLLSKAEWLPAVQMYFHRSWSRNRLQFVCNRCGACDSLQLTRCHSCGQGCAYCLSCLSMGRSKSCQPYICVPLDQRMDRQSQVCPLQWGGKFSPLQEIAAQRAREFVVRERTIRDCKPKLSHFPSVVRKFANDRSEINSQLPTDNAFLIWAVCGAGKTELIFPSMNEILAKGGNVLIATPRKDVVLELLPRLQKVFPSLKVVAVHGSSEDKWVEADVVVSTTHQVLRFYRRFALVVVDEVDAFPFHRNHTLYRAVERAVSINGKILYLSATPPDFLRRQLVKELTQYSATHVLVPQRYHGHPIPVPQLVVISGLAKKLADSKQIEQLFSSVEESLLAGNQLFVFVSRVAEISNMVSYFQQQFPAYANQITGVHAADPEREQKVVAFRQKKYALLVTTTILERGVTIPRSDVIVLGADAPVFDEASLVQIAGRVGRSADYPEGSVLFFAESHSKAITAAIKQVNEMNRLATEITNSGRATKTTWNRTKQNWKSLFADTGKRGESR